MDTQDNLLSNLSRHTNSNHFPNTSLIIVTQEQFLTNPPPHSPTLSINTSYHQSIAINNQLKNGTRGGVINYTKLLDSAKHRMCYLISPAPT